MSCVRLFDISLQHFPVQMKQPGQVADRTVLNVLASSDLGERFILDNLKVCPVSAQSHYTPVQMSADCCKKAQQVTLLSFKKSL